MSTVTLPSWFQVDGFALSSATVQRSFGSPFGGSEQVIDLENDRWHASLSIPPRVFSEAASVEAFIASLRGSTNTVNLYHFARPQPRGTMRGTPTSDGAPAGGVAVVIHTTPGATLLAGDMIGVTGQLFQVAEDRTADGAGVFSVALVNRVRTAFAPGTPIIWDRPTAPFRLASRPFVQFMPGYAQGVEFDFVEAVS